MGGFPRAAPSFALANSGLPWANVLRSQWELGETGLKDRVLANRPAETETRRGAGQRSWRRRGEQMQVLRLRLRMMARLVARFCRPYGAWVCLGGFPRAAPSFAMANSGLPWANVLRSRWELGETELADGVFANRPTNRDAARCRPTELAVQRRANAGSSATAQDDGALKECGLALSGVRRSGYPREGETLRISRAMTMR